MLRHVLIRPFSEGLERKEMYIHTIKIEEKEITYWELR